MKRNTKKAFVKKYAAVLSHIYRLFGRNKIKVAKGNALKLGDVFLKKCRISVGGTGNVVEFEPGLTRLKGCSISIYGNNCHIQVGEGSNLNYSCLHIEDDGGKIFLKRHVTISGQTELAVIEGTSIIIGEDCLFSGNIMFRTGDSHSILDQQSGKRINPSESIIIGNHVWIGNGVRILKGVNIGDHSIVGLGAILSSGDYPAHSVIGGIGHGKVLKTGIDWTAKRVIIE